MSFLRCQLPFADVKCPGASTKPLGATTQGAPETQRWARALVLQESIAFDDEWRTDRDYDAPWAAVLTGSGLGGCGQVMRVGDMHARKSSHPTTRNLAAHSTAPEQCFVHLRWVQGGLRGVALHGRVHVVPGPRLSQS